MEAVPHADGILTGDSAVQIGCMHQQNDGTDDGAGQRFQNISMKKPAGHREQYCSGDCQVNAVIQHEGCNHAEKQQKDKGSDIMGQHDTAEGGQTFSALEMHGYGEAVSKNDTDACDQTGCDQMGKQDLRQFVGKEGFENIENQNEVAGIPSQYKGRYWWRPGFWYLRFSDPHVSFC